MGTILLACDDIGFEALVMAELEGCGHSVVVAHAGYEVMELAPSIQPDMVMLTPALPVFDGFEVTRRLREDPDIPPRLPIIMIAAAPIESRTIEKAGATEVLLTTHNAADIADLLARYLQPTAMPD